MRVQRLGDKYGWLVRRGEYKKKHSLFLCYFIGAFDEALLDAPRTTILHMVS